MSVTPSKFIGRGRGEQIEQCERICSGFGQGKGTPAADISLIQLFLLESFDRWRLGKSKAGQKKDSISERSNEVHDRR